MNVLTRYKKLRMEWNSGRGIEPERKERRERKGERGRKSEGE